MTRPSGNFDDQTIREAHGTGFAELPQRRLDYIGVFNRELGMVQEDLNRAGHLGTAEFIHGVQNPDELQQHQL